MSFNLIKPQSRASIIFGRYTIPNGIKPNEVDIMADIEWLVLHIDEKLGRMLLVSKYALDWECFEGGYSIFCNRPMTSWKTSTIRKRLADEYFNEWFSESEKKLILPCKTSESTVDRLFFLSENEIRKYFNSPESAKTIQPMASAIESRDSQYMIDRTQCCYWTRSVCATGYQVRCVDYDGNIIDQCADGDEVGVRPTMWIKHNAI